MECMQSEAYTVIPGKTGVGSGSVGMWVNNDSSATGAGMWTIMIDRLPSYVETTTTSQE